MDDNETPHQPPPSLWPIGFAAGIACLLTGLVVSFPVAVVGAALAVVFGFLWIRDVTTKVREPAPDVEPETRAGAPAGSAALAAEAHEEEEDDAYPRSTFLAASTLGLGAVIGGVITVPVLGFAILPSFTNQKEQEVDLGPLENFPEGEFVIATYLEQPDIGEVSRRTVFVRANGLAETPEGTSASFTILFSRCVHLGCPVQPNGPVDDDAKKEVGDHVSLTPTQPSGFGCPCHGGQYDTEGNRTAGPPVRALDRCLFSIRDGSLWLGDFYSVSEVEGTGARARITRYGHTNPGVHVDGASAWMYPIEVPG
ncbi:MAG TPA: Rieske 2Fe-2S domain-containing protein [Gaiellaceae bacterium]|nr:Rieske 2Fe-2S domain-containing protein [Gaiellaceae bacterium]